MSSPSQAGTELRMMGVLNVTPDSFSDGGRYLAPERALAQAVRLIGEGADIVDVGGESTRPRAPQVPVAEELARVAPVVEALAAAHPGAVLSIDTSKAAVASAALAAGASMVNDVTALRGDPQMAGVVADSRAACCLMHMRGDPRTMQEDPRYEDVVDEVEAFLHERLRFAVREGGDEQRLLVDPGIGFGKTREHNFELLRRLDQLARLGRPIVIGTSRKSFLGGEVGSRLPATVATNVLALERGASVFRVHDVAPVRAALVVAAATLGRRWTASRTARSQTS